MTYEKDKPMFRGQYHLS